MNLTATENHESFLFTNPKNGQSNIVMTSPFDINDVLYDKPKPHKGLRYNDEKLRYDLLPPHAIEELVKVLTMGAKKYADRNWEQGMSWESVVASLKRHLAAFEKGEDHDSESGLVHMAHVMWNAMVITQYYKTYPQGDDRPHTYLNMPKIGLDIDEVICDFVGGCVDKFEGMKERSIYWNDSHIDNNWDSIKDDHDFWLNLKCKITHEELPFEPHCYITSRSVPTELTQKWLANNGFPSVPVYTVAPNMSKVDIAKESGIDVFVDDRYENFVQLNKAGICTFLLTAPHNERYDVGTYKRIASLKELYNRFK